MSFNVFLLDYSFVNVTHLLLLNFKKVFTNELVSFVFLLGNVKDDNQSKWNLTTLPYQGNVYTL